MPHVRFDRLTYTVYGTTENELIHEARRRLIDAVTDAEQWQLAIDDTTQVIGGSRLWQGTVTATRRPPPKPQEPSTP
jgi:hypothetical protein